MRKSTSTTPHISMEPGDHGYGTLHVVINLEHIGAFYDPEHNTVVIKRSITPPSEELLGALRVIANEGNEKLADEVMDKINKIAVLEDVIENARIEM